MGRTGRRGMGAAALLLCGLVWLLIPVAAASATEDVSPPQLLALSIEPTEVDTGAEAQTVTVTTHITDDLSGVVGGSLEFRSPNGQFATGGLSLISGTANDGTYRSGVRFERFSEAGVWSLNQVYIEDKLGNRLILNRGQIEELGFPDSVLVEGKADTKPPQLLALSIEPTEVDTGAEAQTVTVTTHITDDLSGVVGGSLEFRSPNGQFATGGLSLISGTANDGTYRSGVRFERFSEAGVWSLNQVYIEDKLGNRLILNRGQIEELGLPHEVQVLSGEGGGDFEAPSVEGLSIEPPEINTTVEQRTVTVTAHIIDNITGFKSGSIVFTSPSGEQQLEVTEFERRNGDPLNGSYEIPVHFEKGSESGDWYLTAIRTVDAAGNERVMSVEEMEERGFPRRVIVHSDGGGEDVQAPKLNELLIEPGEIDTSSSARTVSLYAHITDDLSGFESGNLIFLSPSGEREISASQFKRVAGEAKAGTYEIPVTFEQGSESGAWQIFAIRLRDAAGNERTLETKQLEELGLLHTITVRSEKEPEDTDPPHLQNLSIEPTSIDTASTKQPVFLTAKITDNLSGFKEGAVAFVSPEGGQTLEGQFEAFEAEGVYRAVVTFPQGSEPGEWQIAKVRLRDRAGNEVSIPGTEIQEAGLPHAVTVQAVQQVKLTSSPDPTVYGQKVTFTAQLLAEGGPAPLGTVAFADGGATLGVANVNSKGIATFSTTQLGAGEHQITAAYSGDSSHPAGKSAPLTQVVNRASTTVTLTSSLNPAPFGASGTLKASVYAVAPGSGTPAGVVTFREGETILEVVQLSGHNASIPLKMLPVGAHEISASYSGDPNDEASESEAFTQTIVRAETETLLTSTLNPAPFGSSGTLKATIKAVVPGGGVPSGTVTFREGEAVLAVVPLSSGVAKYPLGAFEPGAHAITATYNGSESYEASTAALTQQVNRAETELVLTSSKNPAPKGSTGTIKATVKPVAPGGGTPAGVVTFREGETVLATIPLSNKIATYPLKSLAVGTHEITAVYSGSGDYQASETSITQTITP